MTFSESSSSKVEARLQELAAKGKGLALEDHNARRELINVARSLCHELETPMEHIYRIVVIQVFHPSSFQEREVR
jgi:hypothetical protein